MSDDYVIGVDVGGTNIKAGLVDQDGQIVTKDACPTRATCGVDSVLSDLASLATKVVQAAGVPGESVVGVGIGAPGPLSAKRGIIYRAANLPDFENVPIRDEVARRLNMPAVLANDANAAAYAESWVGAGRLVDDMAMFTLGTGIGGGVVLGGRLIRGHFENAAELGHMIVDAGGRPCSCGQRGCLEQYASAGNIARLAMEAVKRGNDSMLCQANGGPETLTSTDVVKAAADGDELAMQIWDEACRFLAVGCVNIQHAFNPAMIVLGGGMSAAGRFLLNRVRKHYERLQWSLLKDAPEIVLAKLGNDAGIIGAAGLMFDAVRANLSDTAVSMPALS